MAVTVAAVVAAVARNFMTLTQALLPLLSPTLVPPHPAEAAVVAVVPVAVVDAIMAA